MWRSPRQFLITTQYILVNYISNKTKWLFLLPCWRHILVKYIFYGLSGCLTSAWIADVYWYWIYAFVKRGAEKISCLGNQLFSLAFGGPLLVLQLFIRVGIKDRYSGSTEIAALPAFRLYRHCGSTGILALPTFRLYWRSGSTGIPA